MEQEILHKCEQTLSLSKPLSLQTLASVRSLIINPNTSNSTLSLILETLTCSLQLSLPDSITRHHTLKLLTDLSFHQPHLSPFIFDSLRSDDSLLSADSLAALASISDHNPNLALHIDDHFFVSLCFAPCVSVRLWLLRNAERFGVRSHLLFTVFLGFTKDPYPYVRRAALDGLLGLCKSGVLEDLDVIKACYCRAVELLRDMEDCVRLAAVRVVSGWGQMLVAYNQEMRGTNFSDAVFTQLSSMARDMSMEVRVEAFYALGKVAVVSEDILLQTLSKKVLGIFKDKKTHGQCVADCFEISASGAAGAFVHGLEDEFYEVRKSACSSLGLLSVLSEKFAGEALNFLVDMLNDDSVTVRLQALETMLLMANCEHLKVQEIHMHMFLGTLVDKNALVRSAARKILRSVKVPNVDFFKLFVDGLLENLKIYPQDEADIFSVLFYIGRNHGSFAVCIIREVSQEMEPDSDGKLGFDGARVAAFLVLAISAPLSSEQNVCSIQPRIFSYAVTLLGRISCALSDVMDQHSLLAYFSQCSRLSSFSDSDYKGEDSSLHEVNSYSINGTSTEISVQEIGDEVSKTWSWIQCNLKDVATSQARCQLEEEDEISNSMNIVLAKVKNIWPLVQSGYTKEVLESLRACKEEVLTFSTKSLGSDGALAFTLQYIQVVKLLVKVWEHFAPMKKFHYYEVGELELLLGKLDSRLADIRCRFIGLSKEEELHVLELVLVSCLLRLSKVEICCYLTTLKKLSSTISHVEFLHQQGSIEQSKFVTEVKNSLLEIGTSTFDASYKPFLFNQLLESFFLNQLLLSGRLRHIKAELDVPDNSTENPVTFVSGLPVAIPLEIALHNISSENRLWLRITMSEESTQFIFLDLNLIEGYSEFLKFTYIAPFYKTPKAVSFSLRVCIGMECLFEDVHFVKVHGGPKRMLAYLCHEKEVYLSMASKG
ncbi:protein SIEL-like [Pistacia vera]|uniref:protein SIEL-like n=1 Tax=Pistacia vera TaxID=55513 RepID=UPI0012639BE1|nr:protein SIEL-like [Pistacia vera]